MALRHVAVAAILALAVLSGCSRGSSQMGSVVDSAYESVYEAIDTSEYVRLKMILIGTEPEDAGTVGELVSERIEEFIRASLQIEYLPWADYSVRYPLIMAGAEHVDMIYTSDWCYYHSEAVRGAFYELTDDFLEKYMPLTVSSQSPIAFEQAKIDGRIYMICSNGPGIEGESWFAIRGDLREQLGIAPIGTIEQLEEYLKRVAAEIPGVTPYPAAGSVPFFHVMYEQRLNLNVVSSGYAWITKYIDDQDIPDVSDIEYRYFTPEYLDFSHRMKRYAQWGFWDRSALSNAVQVRDAFEGGKAASIVWNQTIFRAGEQLARNNPSWFAEYIDLNPGTIRRLTPYTNDGIAIAAFSRHPERAAMCIDLLKNDSELNDLIKGGIEGVHWINAGQGMFTPGPEAAKYPWNHSQWAFNVSRDNMRRSTETSVQELEFEQWQFDMVVHPAYENFKFDMTPVKAEWVAVEALENEYRRLLELGVTEDPAATIDEFRRKLNAVAFEKVDQEFRRQYQVWADSQ